MGVGGPNIWRNAYVYVSSYAKATKINLAKHRTTQGSFLLLFRVWSNASSTNTSSSSSMAARRYSRSEPLLPSGSRGPWAPQEKPTSRLRCSCAQGAKRGWIAGTQWGFIRQSTWGLAESACRKHLHNKSQPLKGRSTRTRTGNQLFFPISARLSS